MGAEYKILKYSRFPRNYNPLKKHYLYKEEMRETPDSVTSHNIQPNKMRCIVFTYSILQHLVNQAIMFRLLMGSSSGIHIKVPFHKTEHVIYIKIYKNTKSYNVGDFVMDPWYTAN
jgi:hypothetical protein